MVELPHSIKDSTEVRYHSYLVAPLCRVIWVILSSSQQFRESVEEVGQLDFPEKGFGAGGFLRRQQDQGSENGGKLMDSGGESESKTEETGRRKKRSQGWQFQVILMNQQSVNPSIVVWMTGTMMIFILYNKAPSLVDRVLVSVTLLE